MKDKIIKLATVFSGVGAVEQAFLKMKIQHKIVFACDNGERELKIPYDEIVKYAEKNAFSNFEMNKYVKNLYDATNKTNWMKKSYFSNYDIVEDNWYEDIRFIDGTKYHDKIDIFVGGSPCQSFSVIGKRGGLEDARGTLFYDYARLVKEIQPKVFIYENVVGMLNHDKGKTWDIIKSIFESLDYKIYYEVLNSLDYGIPQDRKRLFVVGIKNKDSHFSFPPKTGCKYEMFDFLEENVDARHYLGKKGFEFVTNPNYKSRARINQKIIKTEKANQQFNWNGDFVFEKINYKKHDEDILRRAYLGLWNGEKGVVRQLSYRECFRLMGFLDSFKIVTPNIWSYRQAGNSIVVNIFEAILKELMKEEIL